MSHESQVPSLGAAIRALQFLAGAEEGISLAQMSARLEAPRTSVFRILNTLCSEGLAQKRGTLYFAGVELMRLGLLTAAQSPTWKNAKPFLSQLTHLVGETAHLGVPTPKGILIVEVNVCSHPLSAASRAGAVVDCHASAGGKVLLAFSPKNTVESLLAQPLAKRTSKTLTSTKALLQQLEQIRKQGYALDDEEYFDGVRCLAAPVFDAKGHLHAAIGITAATVRFTRERIPEIAGHVSAVGAAMGRFIFQK